MNELQKAIQFFLNELGLNMLIQYNANNLRASSTFESRMNVKDNKLTLAGYSFYLMQGQTRAAGKQPPSFDIFKWLFDKGITPRDKKTGRFQTYEQAAFAIARGIGQKGTQFQYSTPIDFEKALLQAYKKSTKKINTAIVNEVFKAAKWTDTNTITITL